MGDSPRLGLPRAPAVQHIWATSQPHSPNDPLYFSPREGAACPSNPLLPREPNSCYYHQKSPVFIPGRGLLQGCWYKEAQAVVLEQGEATSKGIKSCQGLDRCCCICRGTWAAQKDTGSFPRAQESCTQGCTSPGWKGWSAPAHSVTHTRVLLLFKATRDSPKVLIVVAAELSVIEKQL